MRLPSKRPTKSVNKKFTTAKKISKGLSKYHLKNNGGFKSKTNK